VLERLKGEPAFRRRMPEGGRVVLKLGSKGFSDLRERFAHPLLRSVPGVIPCLEAKAPAACDAAEETRISGATHPGGIRCAQGVIFKGVAGGAG
jgi:hypothetical protein